jgi:hypothetical protein
MSAFEPSSVYYELTIVGALGPAFCQALKPFRAALCEAQTILRAQVSEDKDLVDLLGALEARGVEIADIVELHPGERR